MANIQLLDGTVDTEYGKVFLEVLQELANFQPVEVNPMPGQIDLAGYEYVKMLEQIAYNPSRGQCNYEPMLLNVAHDQISPEKEKVILTDKDLYAPGLNWCFGGYVPLSNGEDFIIISTARITERDHLFDILAHEIGHMYGAAHEGRSNTYEHLGSHCINDLCVMRQNDNVQDSVAYSRRRHALDSPTYCHQCAEDLTR